MARLSDGTLVAWGRNADGQCDVPPLPPGESYVGVSLGQEFSTAVRSDGKSLCFGNNGYFQCNVPELPAGQRYLDVSAGHMYALALRSDGSLVAWGYNNYFQCNVPPGSFVEISAGRYHALARRDDGVVLGWGDNIAGQCDVPSLPAGVSFVQLDAAWLQSAAVLSDGTAVVWGNGRPPQVRWPRACQRYVEVAALGDARLALRVSDGTIECHGCLNPPALPPGKVYVHVTAGLSHFLAWVSDGTVVAWGDNTYGQCDVPPLPPGLSSPPSPPARTTVWPSAATARSLCGAPTPGASTAYRSCRPARR